MKQEDFQNEMATAFTEALQNEKVISLVAGLVAKKIIQNKTNPSNTEEELVKNHVVFGQEGSATATFMTVKEVTEAIVEFNEDVTIRPRIFGKALISQASATKDSSFGRCYLVEAVLETITPEDLENIAIKAEEVVDEEIVKETKKERKARKKAEKKAKKNKVEIADKDVDKSDVDNMPDEEKPVIIKKKKKGKKGKKNKKKNKKNKD